MSFANSEVVSESGVSPNSAIRNYPRIGKREIDFPIQRVDDFDGSAARRRNADVDARLIGRQEFGQCRNIWQYGRTHCGGHGQCPEFAGLTYSIVDAVVPKYTWTWLPSRSMRAGPPPR